MLDWQYVTEWHGVIVLNLTVSIFILVSPLLPWASTYCTTPPIWIQGISKGRNCQKKFPPRRSYRQPGKGKPRRKEVIHLQRNNNISVMFHWSVSTQLFTDPTGFQKKYLGQLVKQQFSYYESPTKQNLTFFPNVQNLKDLDLILTRSWKQCV